MSDVVNHPKHYNAGQFEVIDVIEDWKLGFNLGNTVKYIARADHKGSSHDDLKKALWYLGRELSTRGAKFEDLVKIVGTVRKENRLNLPEVKG